MKAIHLPVLIGHNTKIGRFGEKGCIEIQPQFGQLCFGLKGGPFNMGGGNFLYIGKGAKLKIKGSCRLAKGIRLKLFEGADLSIGDAFTSNANMIISCMKSISIGEDCLVGWNITILDNDGGHSVADCSTEIVTNNPKPIIIGNHCWLSSNVTLLKGTKIPDNCAVGYGTTTTGKSSFVSNSIVAGNPPKIIKSNVIWGH